MRLGVVVQIDGRASSNRAVMKNHIEKIKTRRRWQHVLFPVMYRIWKSRGRRGVSTASRSAATLLSSSIAPLSPVSQCASKPTPHSLTPTPQLTYRRTTRRRISRQTTYANTIPPHPLSLHEITQLQRTSSVGRHAARTALRSQVCGSPLLSALRKPNAQRRHYPRERPCDPKIRTLFGHRSALTACLGRQRLTCGGAVHNAELTSRTSRPAYRDHSNEQNMSAGDPDDICAHRVRVDTQIVRISRDRGPWAPQRAAHRCVDTVSFPLFSTSRSQQ
jgi:hypothetical protein